MVKRILDKDVFGVQVSKESYIMFILMLILFIIAISLSFFINIELFYVILFYIVLNFLYSKWLKHIAVLDINIIAIGFLLRLFAGGILACVIPSIWILLITYLLALFLAIGKRRSDVLLDNYGNNVRKNIKEYTLGFIDIVLGILSSVIIVCYIFYCISPEIKLFYNSNLLYVSVILVINGIFRYLKLVFVNKLTSSPTTVVLKDRFIQIIIFIWVILMGYLIYFKK